MTEEFLKRFQEANAKAIGVYKKEDEKSLERLKANKIYVGMYLDLVLAFVEVFDYKSGKFNIDAIDKDLSNVIGKPKDVYVLISEDLTKASINLHYGRNQRAALVGLPDFIDNGTIDFDMVNEVLSENGISISENLWDGGERGLDNYIVTFDTSILAKTRKTLFEESEKKKESVLSLKNNKTKKSNK